MAPMAIVKPSELKLRAHPEELVVVSPSISLPN